MAGSRDNIIAEKIQEWLSCRLGLSAHDGHCMVRGPLHERENSRVFYAECDALPTPAAIKWCWHPYALQPDHDSAVRQFEALGRVTEAMQASGRYAVPRPYLLDRERALIAIEWIAGKTITASIASWGCGANTAQGLLVDAGNWLRHFHRAGPLHDDRLDVENRLRNLSDYDKSALARERVFSLGLAELRRSAAAAASIDLKRSWLHGDFKTDNLIISGQRIVGIDLQIKHENAVVYDLAPFINHLDLAFYSPAFWRLSPARERLITAFIEAYNEADSESLLLPLTWVRLYLMLSAWDTGPTRGSSRLRTTILGRYYRSAITKLSARLRELC